MIKEFKEFLLKGNALDLAIGVIIAAAFGKVVNSIVTDLLMPVVGALLQGVNFSTLAAEAAGVKITYGNFIQAVVELVVVGAVLFMVVKAMNKAMPKK